MGFLIQYLTTYAPWIYAIAGLVALYQLYRIWQVRAERKQAVFSLEREKALRDLYSIFWTAMLLLLVMGATYFFSNTLNQAVEPLVVEALEPTPAVPFVPTPTNTPIPATPTATMTPTRLPQPTPATASEADAATPEPPKPAVQAPACPDNRALFLRPGENEDVSGVINVVGSANHDQFQYYKIEYAPAGSENFAYIAGGNSPVVNGVLGSIDTTTLGNGRWTLRLIVVDKTGNFPPPCQVTINVQN